MAQAAWLGPTTTKTRDGGPSLIRQGQGKSWVFAEQGAGKNWAPAQREGGKKLGNMGRVVVRRPESGKFCWHGLDKKFLLHGDWFGGLAERGMPRAYIWLHLVTLAPLISSGQWAASGRTVDFRCFGGSSGSSGSSALETTGSGRWLWASARSIHGSASLIDFARGLGARDPWTVRCPCPATSAAPVLFLACVLPLALALALVPTTLPRGGRRMSWIHPSMNTTSPLA